MNERLQLLNAQREMLEIEVILKIIGYLHTDIDNRPML